MSKFAEDIKQVPSWVWLGGAAAVGLLFVLGHARGNNSATSPTSGATVSSGVPTLGQNVSGFQDYGIYTELANLESQVQTLINQNHPTPTPTPTPTPSPVTPGKFTLTNYGASGKQSVSFLVDYDPSHVKSGSQTYTTYVQKNGIWSLLTSGDIVGYVSNLWGVSNPSNIGNVPGYFTNSVDNYTPQSIPTAESSTVVSNSAVNEQLYKVRPLIADYAR